MRPMRKLTKKVEGDLQGKLIGKGNVDAEVRTRQEASTAQKKSDAGRDPRIEEPGVLKRHNDFQI